MLPSSYADILGRLRELGSFPDDAAAASVLFPVIDALGRMLSSRQLDALADALPEEIALRLRTAQHWTQGPVPDFFGGVAAREGLSLSASIAHAEVVCRVLGEALAAPARARLARDIPELCRLIEPAAAPPRGLRLVPRIPCAAPADSARKSQRGVLQLTTLRTPRR